MSRIVPSLSGRYHADVPPELVRARMARTRIASGRRTISRCAREHDPDVMTGFGQYSIGFRRKSFCDGSAIVYEQDSWCHVERNFELETSVDAPMIMVSLRRHHVFSHQEVRLTLLPPDRREPLGERPFPTARRHHPWATRSTPRKRPA